MWHFLPWGPVRWQQSASPESDSPSEDAAVENNILCSPRNGPVCVEETLLMGDVWMKKQKTKNFRSKSGWRRADERVYTFREHWMRNVLHDLRFFDIVKYVNCGTLFWLTTLIYCWMSALVWVFVRNLIRKKNSDWHTISNIRLYFWFSNIFMACG